MPVYLVRAHVPNATAADIAAAAIRAAASAAQLHREGFRIRYLDTTYVHGESWLGCLYDAESSAVARLATERAMLPFDDIVEAVRYGCAAGDLGDFPEAEPAAVDDPGRRPADRRPAHHPGCPGERGNRPCD